MRLALFTSNFAPHFEGGTERVVRAQAGELRALGYDVSIVCGTDRPHGGEDLERSEVDGVPVTHLPRLPDEHYDIELRRPRLIELARELARDAQVVHVHHWSGFDIGLGRALTEGGTPVVITFHDLFSTCPRFFRSPVVEGLACPERGEVEVCVRCLEPDLPPERERASVALALGRRAQAFEAEALAAAALVAPSRTHAGVVEALLGLAPETIRVIPHGLCADLGSRRTGDTGFPAFPAFPAFDGERPLRVAHFGHRARAKGTLDLARALSQLPSTRVELHLAGSEVEAGVDAELHSMGGLVIVDHGTYAPEELGGLVGETDLAAFPSRAAESYGLVVDEALALGLPVWVSDRGALGERLDACPGAGRVLPAEDSGAWARALARVLDNPDELTRARAAVPRDLPTARDAATTLDTLYKALLSPATQ